MIIASCKTEMASDLQEFDREIAVPKAENRENKGGGRGRGD